MKNIFVGLFSHASYTTDEDISLLLEITNRTNRDIYVLDWGLSGNEITEDYFLVRRNKKELRYDGRLVKRVAPRPEHFVRLASGTSITHKVHLGKVYSLAQKGKYTVALRPEKLTWVTGKLSVRSIGGAYSKGVSGKGIRFVQKNAAFNVVPGKKAQLTLGQQARKMEKKKVPARRTPAKLRMPMALMAADGERGARPPLIKGTMAGIDAGMIQNAHQQAYIHAINALQVLGNGASGAYATWFGDPALINQVKGSFNSIIRDFEGATFTYDLSASDCVPSSLAHTFPGTTTIFLCPAFGDLSDDGLDDKTGCILHEHSHASAGTADFKNGQTACRGLAKTNPGQAVRNADSYGYFSNSL